MIRLEQDVPRYMLRAAEPESDVRNGTVSEQCAANLQLLSDNKLPMLAFRARQTMF